MSRIIAGLFSIFFFVSLASAEKIESPAVKPGDTWTYQATTEQSANPAMKTQAQWTEKHYEATVIRSGSTGILVSRKERGSKQPPLEVLVGSDWSRYRSLDGEEKIVSQPLKFPLEQGESWELKFTENRPSSQFRSIETQLNYTVAGWEEVSVPAGKFKALKIEVAGKWKAQLEPSKKTSTNSRTDHDGTTVVVQAKKEGPGSATGRLYRAYWYVPEAKIYVKSVEENFFPNGTLSKRSTEELESFKVSP